MRVHATASIMLPCRSRPMSILSRCRGDPNGKAAVVKTWFASEDGLAVWSGVLVVLLALATAAGVDLLGWLAAPQVWLEIGKAALPVSKAYSQLAGIVSLLLTYGFFAVLMGFGAYLQGNALRKFLPAFSVVFWISVACWLAGHFAYIAQTPDRRAAMGISWSLGLTGEAGFIVALLAGLLIGNLMPGVAARLKEGARPEWFIKTAIVILGASLGIQAAGATGLVSAIMFRGLAAIIEAYLIYWALVYFIARNTSNSVGSGPRRWPRGSRSAACRPRSPPGRPFARDPVVPIMVSSLVVIFSVVELILLPILAQLVLWSEPMVAAAWMGLAVKTDGAAVASGAVTEALIRSRAPWRPASAMSPAGCSRRPRPSRCSSISSSVSGPWCWGPSGATESRRINDAGCRSLTFCAGFRGSCSDILPCSCSCSASPWPARTCWLASKPPAAAPTWSAASSS